jgi:hypothetical protein
MQSGFLVAVTVMTVIAFAKTTALPEFTADVWCAATPITGRSRIVGNKLAARTNGFQREEVNGNHPGGSDDVDGFSGHGTDRRG